MQRPGTAHRPFPTVRLGMVTFAPVVPTMRNAALPLAGRRPLPLPLGEVAERKRGRRGSTLMVSMDVIIQKTPHGPLSLGCAEPALPEGEPRACGLSPWRSPLLNSVGCPNNCQLSTEKNCQFSRRLLLFMVFYVIIYRFLYVIETDG